jgi:hypothetical protein
MKENRGSFDDRVEIWIAEVKQLDAEVHLDKYVDVIEIRTLGGVELMDGPQSWDGYLVGLSDHERSGLIGQQLDLKLPSGQTGRAVMTDYNSGALTGFGMGGAPF